MNDTDPFASVWGAPGPRESSRHSPDRTLSGALAMVMLFVGLVVAVRVPTATLAGVLVVAVVGIAFGFAVGIRRPSNRPVRLCLPRTGHCVQLKETVG